MVRGKGNSGERFAGLELVVGTQHLCRLLDQSYRLFANTVIVQRRCSLTFGQETQHEANAWRLIMRTWRGCINESNDAVWRKVDLHEFVHTHACRCQKIQSKQSKGRR